MHVKPRSYEESDYVKGAGVGAGAGAGTGTHRRVLGIKGAGAWGADLCVKRKQPVVGV